ncbi:MAG TPA: hypothetical protein PLQ35_04510 [bacterium]|nr:hypothetical protein [bacterium]HQL61535.1 hypothetical protein [bacterium]
MTKKLMSLHISLTIFGLIVLSGYAQEEQLPIRSGPEAVGIVPLTGDVNLWYENGGNSSYWRPDCDILSNGNAIVLGGMRKAPYVDHVADSENAVDLVAIFSPEGELLEPARTAFFTNDGQPWFNTICTTRNDDKFYGLSADTVGGRSGEQYVVHTICNAHVWPDAFPGYPKDYTGDYHTAIQVIGNDGTMRSKLTSPYGSYVKEKGVLRGGTTRFLSNGNIVVLYEDRQRGTRLDYVYGQTSGALTVGVVILGPDGRIVRDMFPICTKAGGENRFGLASGDGWFVCRYRDNQTGITIVAFDNEGNELGRFYPANSIPEYQGDGGGGRGDANGLEAIGDWLYISDRIQGTQGYITKYHVGPDGISVIKTIHFIDHPLSTFEHNADMGVDSAGNVIVMWQDHSWERFQTGRWEALARMFDSNLEPITPSFVMFELGNNTDVDEIHPVLGPGRTKQSRIAMNDQIIIAIAETNNAPYGDPLSYVANEMFSYTFVARVLRNPFYVPVRNWEIY